MNTKKIKLSLKRQLKNKVAGMGYSIQKMIPEDLPEGHSEIYNQVSPYTMTGPLRVSSLVSSIEYISKAKLEGDIVECGVWRGGSIMASVIKLMELNDVERDVYLFDTFEGMSEPTESDVSVYGHNAVEEYDGWTESAEDESVMCYAGIEEVKNNLSKTGYPKEKINFVKGKVEDTLPQNAPEKIALLRLDTDWYESTLHELEHLYPRLQPGGVLIIDDYGFWEGAKKAVDEYLEKNNISILLSRVDGTGRVAIKPG